MEDTAVHQSIRSPRARRRAVAGLGTILLAGLGGVPAVKGGQIFLDFRFKTQPPIALRVLDVDADIPSAQPFVLADVSGDGSPDLVAINQIDERVSVLLGDGTGGFGELREYDVDGTPTSVAVADVGSPFADGGDVDGRPDIIVTDDGGVAYILIGMGDGSFSAEEGQDLEDLLEDTSEIVGLAVADFDRNGRDDLALLDSFDIVVFLCNDAGTFDLCPTGGDVLGQIPTNGTEPIDIAAGDFDGDTRADVAVLNRGSENVSVIYGDGEGGFTTDPRTIPAVVVSTNVPQAMAAGQVDGGNRDDLVVLNVENFDSLGVLGLFPRGRNNFEAVGFTVPFFGTDIALGDFNDDGAVDVLMTQNDPVAANGPTLLAGDGTGRFDQTLFAAPGAETMGGALSAAVADVGGDALPDLVVVLADGERVRVAINTSSEPTPTPTATVTATPTGTPTPTSTPSPSPPPPTHTPTTVPCNCDDDDGCAISAGATPAPVEWAAMLAVLAFARARARRSQRRHE